MLRSLFSSAIRTAAITVCEQTMRPFVANISKRSFVSIAANTHQMMYSPTTVGRTAVAPTTLLQVTAAPSSGMPATGIRSVTKFSLVKGKRKSVKAVLKRFKRLDWGAWIRTHSGRNKHLFKKSPALRRRLRQHVFTNASQSWLLDKMVTDFWRRPKHYIDDPYTPYHKRDEYFATKGKTFKV